jgi:hypothetical protein
MTDRESADSDQNAVLAVWSRELVTALQLDEFEVDIDGVLGLAGIAAHSVVRPAAPLTTFLVGYGACCGRRLGHRERGVRPSCSGRPDARRRTTTERSGVTRPVRPQAVEWHSACAMAFAAASTLPTESVSIDAAVGRILAREVRTLYELPHYSSSAMDGWAVAGDARWEIVEPEDAAASLLPGQAIAVVTGGLIPPGTRFRPPPRCHDS